MPVPWSLGFFFRGMILPPLELPFIEQIALKHSSIAEDEASPCVLGNLFCGTGVVQNDLREDIVCPTAHTEVQIVLDQSHGLRA